MGVYLDRADRARVEESLRRLAGAAQRRALARAITRAGTETKTEAVRRAREELPGLRAKAVRDRVELRPATAASPAAEMLIPQRPGILLVEYSARQTKKGVSVAVKRGRRLTRQAFIAPGRVSGKRIVFARQQGAKRYPIRALYGPSAFDVLQDEMEALGAFAENRMREEVLRQIELAAGGRGGF